MTRQQTTVIWLGLVLVALNLIIHIGEVKSVIFGGSTGQTASGLIIPKTPGQVAPGIPSNLGGQAISGASPTNPTPTPPNVQVA